MSHMDGPTSLPVGAAGKVAAAWAVPGVEAPHDMAVIAAPVRLAGKERPIALLIGETRPSGSRLQKYIVLPQGVSPHFLSPLRLGQCTHTVMFFHFMWGSRWIRLIDAGQITQGRLPQDVSPTFCPPCDSGECIHTVKIHFNFMWGSRWSGLINVRLITQGLLPDRLLLVLDWGRVSNGGNHPLLVGAGRRGSGGGSAGRAAGVGAAAVAGGAGSIAGGDHHDNAGDAAGRGTPTDNTLAAPTVQATLCLVKHQPEAKAAMQRHEIVVECTSVGFGLLEPSNPLSVTTPCTSTGLLSMGIV